MYFLADIKNYFDLPANVYLTDFNGNILECNDIQAKSLGDKKPSSLVGKNLRDFFSENDSKVVLENNNLIRHTASPKIFVENAIVDDQCYSYLSYKMPILSSTKKVISLLGTSILLNNNSHLSNQTYAMNNCNAATLKFLTSLTYQAAPLKIEGKNISKREQTCLYYLISGMTAKGIARKLALSPRTVEYYIARMKEKFNCKSKMELIIKAISAN